MDSEAPETTGVDDTTVDADASRAGDWHGLARSIKRWGRELGFADIAICDAWERRDGSARDTGPSSASTRRGGPEDVAKAVSRAAGPVGQRLDDATDASNHGVDPATDAERRLQQWLALGYHGTMEYMARHGLRRARPSELVPGTLSVIVARMDYLPRDVPGVASDGRSEQPWIDASWRGLDAPLTAGVSRYAHGRDYHKVVRGRLQRLADRIADTVGPLGHRVFADSAPVMEVELARRAGLGWRGKHTLLLSRDGGSMFFLGEILVDVPLPPDAAAGDHCGTCTRCVDVCPTRAIVAPYVLDARRCISYLTIEHEGPIPHEFRRAIGNRIYGCDDCQLVCPWNRFAKRSPLPDFDARPIASRTLLDVFAWDEETFLRQTEGSAIRRIGHERWLRNVAVALGNALAASDADHAHDAIRAALARRRGTVSPLVDEHIDWALATHGAEDATEPRGSTAAA